MIPTSCSTITKRFLRTRSFPVALAALTVAGASPVAHALPTGNPFPGPTGLGVIPTTDTAPSGAFETSLAYEYIKVDDGGGEADMLPLANVTYGFGRGEVGAVYAHERTSNLGGTFDTNYFALHGKYRVYEAGGTGIAIGGHYYDFGSEGGFDLGSTASLYITASQSFTTGNIRARVHGGLLGQRTGGAGNADSTTIGRPFAGIEVFPNPDVSLALDYLHSHGDDVARAATFSVRYQPTDKNYGAQIGVGALRDDLKFFVGATYRFGG